MVKAALYGYFLLFCSLRSVGQSISSRQHSQYLTAVPFQVLSGGVVLISAKLDDHSTPLHFILDSGSGGISIDSTKANALGLALEYPDKNIVGIGGFSQTAVSNNHSIEIEQLSISNLSFHIYNYQLLSAIYGVQIDGVIGYPVLSRYVVQLDYENLVMGIFSAGEFTYPKKGSLFSWKGNGIPQHEVSFMRGKSTKKPLYFDTGAGLAVLLNEDFALESGILNKKRKLFTTRAEGIGGKKLMQITVVKKIKLGPFVFRDVPTYIFSDEIGVTGYPLLGGLLGNDILRRFLVTLNFPANEIHLLPNRNFYDPFDYGYAGFSMLLMGEEVWVEDVIENSPAALAGLKSGDEIMSINGDFSGNVQRYRSLIQQINTEIKMIVRRQENLVEISFQPISIY